MCCAARCVDGRCPCVLTGGLGEADSPAESRLLYKEEQQKGYFPMFYQVVLEAD